MSEEVNKSKKGNIDIFVGMFYAIVLLSLDSESNFFYRLIKYNIIDVSQL